jgi:anti-sigma factor RsiW
VSHDTPWLSSLVDGELDHDSRDQLLAHLAHCDECRGAVEASRRVKSAVASLPDPVPSESFVTSLIQLADPQPPAPPAPPAATPRRRVRPGRAGRTAPPAGRPGNLAASSGPGRAGVSRLRRPLRMGVAGAVSLAGMAFVVAFAAGGEQAQPIPASVAPPVESFSAEHAGTVANQPLSDADAVTASFERGVLTTVTGR